MVDVFEKYKDSIGLCNNATIVTDDVFKKLLENAFSILGGSREIHNLASLCNSKVDVVTEIYAAILSITAEFVRQCLSLDEIEERLKKILSSTKTRIYCDLYRQGYKNIEITLLNVGNNLPHVTDLQWKIDYIVKTNLLDESEAPLFRISLITEKYDATEKRKKLKNINLTCNAQELQDLVYKLKDCVRHCQKLTVDH